MLNFPASHCVHIADVLEPSNVLKLPIGQSVHNEDLSDPVAVLNVPAWQGTHAPCRVIELYVPALHGVQLAAEL